MKRHFLIVAIAAFLVVSCSSDKEVELSGADAIVGTWDATELVINNETASDDAKNGRDILNFLTAKDCYILTFTFHSDLSVTAQNSSNYVEISVNSAGTGLEIPCPSESDSESSTYTYDGKILTVVDSEGATITVEVSIDKDIMTVDAADLEIPNFSDSGDLIFIRR